MNRFLLKPSALLLTLTLTVQAQTPDLTFAEVIAGFELGDEFEQTVRVRPITDGDAFPWQMIGGAGKLLGVIEGIELEVIGTVEHYVLDAQRSDGNDLKYAVPVAYFK